MRTTFACLVLTVAALGGCGGESASGPDPSSDEAEQYLAELDGAGLSGLFEDDAAALEFVPVACNSAAEFQMEPEEMIETGEVNEQSSIALRYCDTSLNSS